MATRADNRGVSYGGHEHRIGAAGGGAPLQAGMVLDEAVCDQVLVLLFHVRFVQ